MIIININKNKSGKVVRSLLTSGVAFALLVGIGTSCSQSMDEEAMTRTGAPMTVTATMQGVGKPAATISEVVSGSDATLPSSRTTASDVATGGSYTASWQKGDLVNVTFHCYSDAGATTEIAASQMATGNIQTLTYDGTSWMAMPTSLRLPAGTYSVKAVYSYIRTYSSADDSPVDATTTSMIINRGTEQIEGQSTVLIPDDITKTGIAIAPAADNWQRQTALIRLTGLALGQSVTVTTASGVATTVSCPTVQAADPTQPANAALTSTVCLHQPVDDPANTTAVTTVTADGVSGVVKPTFHAEAGRLYSINAPMLLVQQGAGDEDGGQSYTTWRGTYAQFNNNDVGVINIDKYKEWIIDLSAESDKKTAASFIRGMANFRTTAVNMTLTGIETLPDNAFDSCTKLSSISLPVTTSIGNFAFSDCTSLSSVNFPMLQSTGNYSLRNCKALVSVSLPKAITIGRDSFYGCDILANVDLPLAESIADDSFSFCMALKNISLPAAKSIGRGVFYACLALSSVDLPSATSFGEIVFAGTPLTTLNLTATGAFTLDSGTLSNFSYFGLCTLTLNADKTGGSIYPQVGTDGLTWFGQKWKAIQYK
jgi:hypothetical protein